VPGLVCALSRDGEVEIEAVGTMGLDDPRAIQPDTVFRIASMTKPVTAVATLILIEECRLHLDAPVNEYLPELAGRQVLKRIDAALDDTVPADRAITVRDLLTFRSGHGITITASPAPVQQVTGGVNWPGTVTSEQAWLEHVSSLPLLHQPGTAWAYNTGSDLLGIVIARATGQSLGSFLAERIFGPLGMVDTGFTVPASSMDRLGTCYQPDRETGELTVFDPVPGSAWSKPQPLQSGAAGLASTAEDYLRFATMLANHGRYDGGRILARPTVELMITDQLTTAQKAASHWAPGHFDSNGWGFGVGITTRRDDLAAVGTYGWDGGLGTSWRNDRAEGLTGILLTQRAFTSSQPTELQQDFWTSAYQAIDD
jgi:CubicO group peptidase (beta-lactamase class C family)